MKRGRRRYRRVNFTQVIFKSALSPYIRNRVEKQLKETSSNSLDCLRASHWGILETSRSARAQNLSKESSDSHWEVKHSYSLHESDFKRTAQTELFSLCVWFSDRSIYIRFPNLGFVSELQGGCELIKTW